MKKSQKEQESPKQLQSDYLFLPPEDIDMIIKSRLATTIKKGSKSAGQWTEQEINIRNMVIWEYICKQGLSRTECARQMVSRWGIHLNTAYRYIQQAIASLCIDYEEKEEEYRQKHIERIESILQDAIDRGAQDTALKCLDQLAKINGIYNEKKDINLNNGNITFKFGTEQ